MFSTLQISAFGIVFSQFSFEDKINRKADPVHTCSVSAADYILVDICVENMKKPLKLRGFGITEYQTVQEASSYSH
jgi:hypothetical protein